MQNSGRPPRNPELEPYINNMAMWRSMLVLGDLPHAGDDDDPRPMPQTTLHDLKQRFAGSAPSGSGPLPEALFFAFYSDRYNVEPEKGVTLPPEHLWWLAMSEDTALLSDRITHHYTTIGSVDRNGERISFSDQWPDDFFLLPGRNTIGVAAKRDPGLSVTKDEFLRSITGIVTWDTPALIDSYLDAFPEQKDNVDLLIRFGYALLDAEADIIAAAATGMLVHAARLAASSDLQQAERAASLAYLAGRCGIYYASRADDEAAVAMLKGLLHPITSVIDHARLEKGLSPRELTRLGCSAGNVRDFQSALSVLGLALDKDPDFEDAYWLRATAHLQCDNVNSAAEDAEQALVHNQKALDRLSEERDQLDPRGRFELEWKNNQIEGRRGRRISELSVLSEARAKQGEFDAARNASEEVIRLRPDDPVGYAGLAKVELASGKSDKAIAAFQSAAENSTDPKQGASFLALADKLKQTGSL